MKSSSTLNWRGPLSGLKQEIEPEIRSWLDDHGSLTQRLKDWCPGEFSVEVLEQRWGLPDHSEAQRLQIPPDQQVLFREVHLKCDQQLCVYARSVIPQCTLNGPHSALQHLGNKPLGEYLFAISDLVRERVEWTALNEADDLYRQASPNNEAGGDPVWGRRSLFLISQQPLLVSEFFLPLLFRSR